MPKKPNDDCLRAVKTLTEFHTGSCATYFSRNDESAVIVVSDPDLAERIVFMLGVMLSEDDEDYIEEIDGIPVMIPEEPIEA